MADPTPQDSSPPDPWAKYNPQEIPPVDPWAKYNPTPVPESGSTWLGALKAGATGLAKSIPQLVGTITAGLYNSGAINPAADEGLSPYSDRSTWGVNYKPPTLSPDWATNAVGKAIGGWYQPKGPAESIAEGAGETLPYGILAPAGIEAGTASLATRAANLAGRLGLYGALPGATGRAAGETVKAVAPNAKIPIPYTDKSIPLSSAAEFVGSFVSPESEFLRGLVTPFGKVEPAMSKAAATIEKATGKSPTVGQLHNNPEQINREISTNPNINQQQADALTKAYTSKVDPRNPIGTVTGGQHGIWLTNQRNRIQNEQASLSNETFIDPQRSAELSNGLKALEDKATASGHPDYTENVVKLAQSIGHPFSPTVNAISYQRLHDALIRKADNLSIRDPDQANFYRSVAALYDKGVNDTLNATGRQPIKQLWDLNQNQSKALSVIENVANNMKPGQFNLTPQAMQAADREVNGFTAVNAHKTPFGDLHEAAATAFNPLKATTLPESRSWAGRQWPRIAGLGAAAAARYFGFPSESALEAGLTGLIAAGREGTLGSVPYSRFRTVGAGQLGQAYGKNRILPYNPEDLRKWQAQAAIRALMSPPPDNQSNTPLTVTLNKPNYSQ